MASGTLYTYPNNFRAFKALIAAQYGGGNVKVASDFVFGQTNKSPDFLKKFPLGKVPAFETSDGHYITESNAIAYYVASSDLKGTSEMDKAAVLEWMSFSDNELLPASCAWVFPYLGIIDYRKPDVETAKTEVTNIMNYLNNFLLTRTYLVSERITLADITVACTLLQLYQHVMDPAFRKKYQNVNRWFTTIVNQPKVKTVLNDVKLCDKAPEITTKPKEVHSGGKGDQGGKKKQDKKEDKKAKEVKEEPAEEMDAAEEALAAEPKSKDPFDALPKGTFIMDEFKRSYSNEDTDVSIPFFWSKFDKENYSIWLGEYKYSDELKKVFMSCNLITGMFQRLDKMRKNAFASVCLFGKDDDSTISGIWVWRGHNLAFEMSPDWQVDYESYTWSKLNPDDEAHKKMINDYLAWTGEDKKGRAFNQGKIFK